MQTATIQAVILSCCELGKSVNRDTKALFFVHYDSHSDSDLSADEKNCPWEGS
jgi:hypothetical protein